MRKERGNTVPKELFKLGFYIFLFVSICLQLITSYFIQPKYGGPQEINLGFILLSIPLIVEWARRRSPLEYYGVRANLLFSRYSMLMIIIGVGLFILFFLLEKYILHIFEELAKQTSTYAPGGFSRSMYNAPIWTIAFLGFFFLGIGAFIEEIVFRGLILFKLNQISSLHQINPAFAIIFQAIIFGSVHAIPAFFFPEISTLIRVWLSIYPTAIGLFLGWIVIQKHSIIPSWVIHWTVNYLTMFCVRMVI